MVYVQKELKGILVIILIVLTTNSYLNIENDSLSEKPVIDDIKRQYTVHEAIKITNDGNFTDYGFFGTGIETDPYIMRNIRFKSRRNQVIAKMITREDRRKVYIKNEKLILDILIS